MTVVIPTIPPRADNFLMHAMFSVQEQTVTDYDLHVVTDREGYGPATLRNLGVQKAQTEWIAFLDDDDEMDPHHLEFLLDAAKESGADVIWPWFRVRGGTDPFPGNRGRQWDPKRPHIFPITTLVRRDAFLAVGGFTTRAEAIEDPNDPGSGRYVSGEDWRLWLALNAAGAHFHHLNRVTWTWNHHDANTSGLPERWR